MGIKTPVGVVVNVGATVVIGPLTGEIVGAGIDMLVCEESIVLTPSVSALEFIVSAGAVISIGHSIDARIGMLVD